MPIDKHLIGKKKKKRNLKEVGITLSFMINLK